ncbi:NADH:flavin oxidoreductase/NADH oxidase [Pseudarthrobacter sp. CCNWLW207]|uniref:NADH:flavin oxidoreductase/NADH oxidase n=1 Tax=Pseudarthrobacter sp. CCNWLW207 TaxID=3127468 RepID=UPI00307746ED
MARPLTIRGLEIPNRIWMSPMCQYSAGRDGVPTNWHMVHYISRAIGGSGIVMVESTAIGPRHRTTAGDLGIWNGQQVEAHFKLSADIRGAGAVAAIQLQSAGRKSSHQVPWLGGGQNSPIAMDEGGWTPMAPSAKRFGNLMVPAEMTVRDIDEVVEDFAHAASNAHEAGYDVVEIHAAHGYLLHQFLSPISNHRVDDYGGSMENRMRLPLRVARAVRDTFPQHKPVFVRMTATDWIDGGITLDEASVFARSLAAAGIDLLDVTSGALSIDAPPPNRQALNVEFAQTLRAESGVPVAPVGQLSDPALVGTVLEQSTVDAVMVGRALLRDPYFALRLLGDGSKAQWPRQYHRAL